jgi:hypothetical protein
LTVFQRELGEIDEATWELALQLDPARQSAVRAAGVEVYRHGDPGRVHHLDLCLDGDGIRVSPMMVDVDDAVRGLVRGPVGLLRLGVERRPETSPQEDQGKRQPPQVFATPRSRHGRVLHFC